VRKTVESFAMYFPKIMTPSPLALGYTCVCNTGRVGGPIVFIKGTVILSSSALWVSFSCDILDDLNDLDRRPSLTSTA